jgi:hypothetical protein
MGTREHIETSFKYIDEFGNVTELNKTHPPERTNDGGSYFLFEEFKLFLTSCGFHEKWVNKVQYIEDDQEVVKKK